MDHASPFEPTVLGAMWKYKWLATLIVLITTGLALAYAYLSPVSYQALSSLVVEDPRATSLFDVGSVQNPQRYVADQAAILASGSVLQRVAETEPALPDAESVLAGLDIFWDTTSNVIDIVFTSDEPEDAVAGANAVASAYGDIRTENASASFSAAMTELENSITEVENQIGQLQARIRAEIAGDPSIGALDAQLSHSLARLVDLQDELPDATGLRLDEIRDEIDDIFQQLQASLALTNLQQENPELTLLLEEQSQTVLRKADLLQRRDELNVESQLASNGIVVFSPALFSEGVGADLRRFGAVGVILGFLLAAASAYLIALRKRRFAYRTQPEMILGVRMVAEIPDFGLERLKGSIPVRTEPNSVSAEAFRFASAAMDIERETGNIGGVHSADSGQIVQSFVVVSPSLGDGKTIVAANSALASSRQGKRVLAIDADFGHQALTALLNNGQTPEVGLTELIVDELPFEHIVQRVPMIDGAVLDLVSRGSVEIAAPDFFRSEGLRHFFEAIRRDYDVVIIDTPPLLHVAYASTLVRYADRVLIVVSHGQSVGPTEELANRLAFLETEVMGYVYNKAPLRDVSRSEGSLQDVLGHSNQPRS